MANAIPLSVALKLLKRHDDDRLEHLLRVRVGGSAYVLEVEMESDFYEWPRIKEFVTHGGIDLPMRLQDLLIFKCFELLVPLIDDGAGATMIFPDATAWIETVFLSWEAAVLLTEFRRQIAMGAGGPE